MTSGEHGSRSMAAGSRQGSRGRVVILGGGFAGLHAVRRRAAIWRSQVRELRRSENYRWESDCVPMSSCISITLVRRF